MKFQTPTIGGVRKVIRTDNNVTVGTTIAEVGSNTITLAQLAQIITQIQSQQQNNGGGNVGGGAEASIVLGPGLSGGGVLVGNVPIRLTAPIPWGLDDGGGGGDGDPGPPGAAGPQGVMGSQGPQGIPGTSGTGSGSGLALWVPEENWPDDIGIPGPIGPAGAVGATGAQGPAGTGAGGGGGTLMMWVPEENWPDDPLARMPSQLGFLTVNGQENVNGFLNVNGPLNVLSSLAFGSGANAAITFAGATPTINAAAAAAVLTINAVAQQSFNINNQQLMFMAANGVSIQNAGANPQLTVQAGFSAGNSFGLLIQAGEASTDYNWRALNANGSVQFAELYGNGGFSIGTSSIVNQGPGTINVQKGYFLNGQPLSQGGNATPAGIAHGMIVDDNYGDDQGFDVSGAAAPPPQVGSFTFTATGMTTSPTGTGLYAISGAQITLFFPVITGTSNANSFTLTGLPSVCQPARSLFTDVPGFCIENNTLFPSSGNLISVAPGSGTVTFLFNGTTTGWTTTGTKGVSSAFCVTYLLN